MKYIDTLNETEWPRPPKHTGALPNGVIVAPSDCPLFQPLPEGKRIVWVAGLPMLEDIPARTAEELEAEALAAFKIDRQALVDALTVTVNGREYDANETAQRRMLGAADAADTLGSTTVPLWVLADNTVAIDVPVADLRMAHALAFVAMSKIWVKS
jgi:hypothetical protein